MKRLVTIALSLIISHYALAQINLDTQIIPDSLTVNASAIIRYDLNELKIRSIKNAIYTNRYAVTILNPEGDKWASVYLYYSKIVSVRKINARVYDSSGKIIKKLKNTEIEDLADYSDYSLYSDYRRKHFDLKQNQYPYTIEVEYEREYDGLLFLPSWLPIPSENIAVQASSFAVSTPKGYSLRYKLNKASEPKILNLLEEDKYSWTAKNLKAIQFEPYSSNRYSEFPSINLAPSQFELEGFEGDLSSWKSFGIWINSLTSGLDDLPDNDIEEIRKLIGSQRDETAIIKIVYEYLQSRTRYVSIQLGIGGWQPFANSVVSEKGYGDCKALTFYTKSILDKLGIPAKYTLVSAGSNASTIDKDFPDQQFNHAFLCVPLKNDTIWLECTSQTNPFGYLGEFTSDRDVLVIDKSGGKLVHTPTYKAEDNLLFNKINLVLTEDGNAIGDISTTFNSLSYDYIHGFERLIDTEKTKFIQEWYALSGMTLLDHSYAKLNSSHPSFTLNSKIEVDHLASSSGKRIFLVPNLVNKILNIPEKVKNRKTSFDIRFGYSELDSIIFDVPENFELEYLPKPKEIASQFGTYKSHSIFENGKVTFYRFLKVEKGEFRPDSYDDYVDFYTKCARYDKQKIVFIKS